MNNVWLPSFEAVPLERADARAEFVGAELTRMMLEPLPSISARAGKMEVFSPLFCDSLANPQPSLFAGAAVDHSDLVQLIDGAGDELTDLWRF
jgi:hypothetical protein